ncbi:hypothetical protein [Kiloniella laminariae]|uniref:hypothetical protein n=1 Tax=Kiloniella laminariae TaxID=454162 RepID=UPI000360223F|nr:hypothetical protein [Kiloniella laminariae]
MYLIADAAGPIGRSVTEQLVGQGQLVRILTADASCRDLWRGRGAEVNEGDPAHKASWIKALDGVQRLLLILPPFSRDDGSFTYRENYCKALFEALDDVPEKPEVILLSAMGAGEATGWADFFSDVEKKLMDRCRDLMVLRIAFLMENLAPALTMAKSHSVFPVFLADGPAFPMVANRDVVSLLLSALLDPAAGQQLLELHGPRAFNLDDISEAVRNVLSKHIAAISLPEDQWSQIFQDQGLSAETAQQWIIYYQGLNSGLVCADPQAIPLAGETSLSDALFQIWKALQRDERAAVDPERKIYEGLV